MRPLTSHITGSKILANASTQRIHDAWSRWTGSATMCWIPATMN